MRARPGVVGKTAARCGGGQRCCAPSPSGGGGGGVVSSQWGRYGTVGGVAAAGQRAIRRGEIGGRPERRGREGGDAQGGCTLDRAAGVRGCRAARARAGTPRRVRARTSTTTLLPHAAVKREGAAEKRKEEGEKEAGEMNQEGSKHKVCFSGGGGDGVWPTGIGWRIGCAWREGGERGKRAHARVKEK